ncbi:hypothetical protein [Candidatus Contubernalis alkaliaceticus]|uniref:hypothetical protein n=1 Tax=Candidatus Contubernalis alkaliaceticus TaxID=338645 RepID=UPI001F4BF36A|nr:hypothetical protein [Candidatus Contubernalis alkalaceticus]UNC90649.1 hypothetical protein HUE98_00220 [Candidatus Contubernalis alkalaceticus]
MKIWKPNLNVHKGAKIFVLAVFYLFVIFCVSIVSSENLADGVDVDKVHKNQTLQIDEERMEESRLEEIIENNILEKTKDTEWRDVELFEEVVREEAEKEPETTGRDNNAYQKTISENIGAQESEQETLEKDMAQSETVQAAAQEIKYDQSLNKYVLEIIKTYPIGPGNYPYLLNNDYANYNGVTTTLTYQGKTLLKAHPSGNRSSHCVGITFEVLFRALQERNRQLGIPVEDFNGMNWDNLHDFVLNWYAASGSKRTNNIVLAVEKYGIGKRITNLEDVQPGDFIDFDRENGGGHAVVFINWIKESDGRIIGLRYWSSQGSTGGINYNEEFFNVYGKNGAKYGRVIKEGMFIVRIFPVSQYK